MVTARTRLELAAFWRMLVYLLNGVIFIFIGLQLPQVMEGLQHRPLGRLLLEATAISAVAILVRLLWIFPSAYIPRFLFREIRARDPYPDWRHLAIIGWSGMRGVDSLATALALPFVTAAGAPFPGRDSIIFISFIVILLTLVAQGLTLPLLIRVLKVKGDSVADCEEHIARVTANEAALHYLEARAKTDAEHLQQLKLLKAQYQERLTQLAALNDAPEPSPDGETTEIPVSPFDQLARQALGVEREALITLRNQHRINDETLRIVQRDIDLADARLFDRES
jgi:CPA1 family monovalent cation:H+ antiporter